MSSLCYHTPRTGTVFIFTQPCADALNFAGWIYHRKNKKGLNRYKAMWDDHLYFDPTFCPALPMSEDILQHEQI